MLWLTMGRSYADVVVGSGGGPGKAHGDGLVNLEMMHAAGQVKVNSDMDDRRRALEEHEGG